MKPRRRITVGFCTALLLAGLTLPAARAQEIGGIAVPGNNGTAGYLNAGYAWIQTLGTNDPSTINSLEFELHLTPSTVDVAGYIGVFDTSTDKMVSVLYASSSVAGTDATNQLLDFSNLSVSIPTLSANQQIAVFLSDRIYTVNSTTVGGTYDSPGTPPGSPSYLEQNTYSGSTHIGSGYYSSGQIFTTAATLNAGTYDFAVNVPEPPSFGLWIGALSLLGVLTWRRRPAVARAAAAPIK